MNKLSPEDLVQLDRKRISGLDKSQLVDLTEGLRDLCLDLYEKVNRDSSNSSKPPSSDDPFKKKRKGEDDGAEPEKVEDSPEGSSDGGKEGSGKESGKKEGDPEKPKPGRQQGAQGFGRSENAEPERIEDHFPEKCVVCSVKLSKPPYPSPYTGHYTYELEKDEEKHEIRLGCTLHRYHSIVCECGHENRARPGEGFVSEIEGRKRDLKLSENRLIGPMFATFIAALNRKYRMSRNQIRQYLVDWFGFRVSTGTICQCVREAGVACYPVVDELIEELQEEKKVNLDETPWYQKGLFRWLWVAVGEKVIVYIVGSRKKETLLLLITEAFLGWLVTDGYGAYRGYSRRQRCLAHLIRKAIGLTKAPDEKARKMGEWYLREMRGLIKAVAEGEDGGKECGPILARLKRACNLGSKQDHAKLKSLAKEILNDWDAVVAFVKNPELPPTNNDAERALRMAVIYRKVCFGTRTEEGSRSFAAFISVMETCRLRGVNPWEYIASIIARARRGEKPTPIPTA